MKLRQLLTILTLIVPLQVWADEPEEGQVPFNGIVTDMTGTPLKGVRVFLHSESYSAKTDKKGHFGLTNVAPTDTIHLIYKRERYAIAVEGRKSMRIHLGDQVAPVAQEDQELVDIGYGWVKRRESLQPSTGIRGEDLIRGGYTNILQALQGRVPGLQIKPSSRPGEEPQASMRGINSIYMDQTPLFIVDGVIVPSLDFINIHDVDYIEVLRDASIYGSRGANGAILVHTKKGKK